MNEPKSDKAYHHGNLRAALLEAVGDTIREQGVGSLSLRAVARRAGVSHSAPAHHFGDKLGMLTAFAVEGFNEFRTRMEHAVQRAETAEDAFHAMGLIYVEFAEHEPERFDVMFRSEMHDKDDPELREAAFSAFGTLTDAVGKLCDGIDDLDPTVIAIEAWAKVHGLATLWRDGALQMFVDDPLPLITEKVMESLPHPPWVQS